jgi:hypothetical protein
VTYNHQSQYQPGADAITRSSGCTWTSLATGIAATTGGTHHPSPDTVHDLLPRSQETNPATPGWSLEDAAKAASRYGMAFQVRSGDGWQAAISAHLGGHYVLLQGDSDQFGNATCSGAFDGDHCIGIHPRTKVEAGITYWWIDDPICATGRWERVAVLKRYATKLWASIRFGYFLQPVPAAQHVAVVPEGTKGVRLFTVEHTAKYPNGVVTAVQIRHDMSAIRKPCSAPKKYPWPGHLGRVLVKLDDGPYIQAKFAHEASS